MNSDQNLSLVTLLQALGFGPKSAGIASLIVLGWVGLGHLMSALPVPDAASPAWYRVPFGILARLTGNYGKNAPVPPSGLPAGGIVPTPPKGQ